MTDVGNSYHAASSHQENDLFKRKPNKKAKPHGYITAAELLFSINIHFRQVLTTNFNPNFLIVDKKTPVLCLLSWTSLRTVQQQRNLLTQTQKHPPAPFLRQSKPNIKTLPHNKTFQNKSFSSAHQNLKSQLWSTHSFILDRYVHAQILILPTIYDTTASTHCSLKRTTVPLHLAKTLEGLSEIQLYSTVVAERQTLDNSRKMQTKQRWTLFWSEVVFHCHKNERVGENKWKQIWNVCVHLQTVIKNKTIDRNLKSAAAGIISSDRVNKRHHLSETRAKNEDAHTHTPPFTHTHTLSL